MSTRVDRHDKRSKDASNIGLSGKAHLEMMKADICPALPFWVCKAIGTKSLLPEDSALLHL